MNPVRPLPYDYDVVSRRVNQRLPSLRHALHLLPLDIGQLRIDQPFTGEDKFSCWSTTGRLYGHGARLARYTRVTIELGAWSQHASELRLRPKTTRLAMWGPRRQGRYFRLAHDAADELVRSLDAAVRRYDATVTLSRRSIPDQRTAATPLQWIRSPGA
jgi:hypothetical protein